MQNLRTKRHKINTINRKDAIIPKSTYTSTVPYINKVLARKTTNVWTCSCLFFAFYL